MKPGRAEIVGAGFGGLVAAIALAERGWTVRVSERRASLRGEGYGIAIHRNMAHIFAEFGLLDAVLAGGMHIDRRDSMDASGKVVMSARTLRSPYRIDRQHIIALLAERAREKGVDIRFEAEVVDATPDGTLTFRTGERGTADLVVAADGVSSVVRDRLGLLAWRGLGRDGGVRVTIPRRPEEIAADATEGTVMIEAWADKRRVLFCPVTQGEFYFLLTCTARDAAARATPIEPATWQKSFPALAPLFERIRDEADWEQARWDRFLTIKLKRWSRGRVAVLGDAAHAMAPYLAQGAGHAMMNAVGLAVAVEEAGDIDTALAAWEARERPLTEHTQNWTRIYSATMFLPRPLKRASILIERKVPWVGAQYLRTANHVPTGCRPLESARI